VLVDITSLSVGGFASQQLDLSTSVLGGTSSSLQQWSEQLGLNAMAAVGSSSQQPLEQSGSGALAVAEMSSQQPSERFGLSTSALAEVPSQQPSEQPASGPLTLGGVLPSPQQASAQLELSVRVSGSAALS
jgi:hypothetical protein